MNPIVADIEMMRSLEPVDIKARALTGIFRRVRPVRPVDDEGWMAVNALVYREAGGDVLVAVAGEGMPLRLNDVIVAGPACALALHFVMGGEAGINPGTTAQIVSERSLAVLHTSLATKLGCMARLWGNLSHEKSQKLLVQTNGGVMGDKDTVPLLKSMLLLPPGKRAGTKG